MNLLQGKKIVLGITGSIAAFKSIILLRLLLKAGADVKVILTPSAADFVSPLTLATLSKNPVLTQLSEQDNWANHVLLGRWADLMLIAPLSCNTLAKMANGICDNLLLAVYLSSACPVAVAPAMDEDMWKHPATQANLSRIQSFGHELIPVAKGELASGLSGEGRMQEPETILQFLQQYFSSGQRLAGKRVLVNAGPTYEPIDPVRFIGNRSTGKMGVAIARELKRNGADVTLVLGPVADPKIPAGMQVVPVQTAAEMLDACKSAFQHTDLAIMSAAVADFTAAETNCKKVKKLSGPLVLELVPTADILKTLGALKKPGQVLVGFALETDNERENARMKLEKKNADLIVLNSLRDAGAGFATDTNKVTLIGRGGLEIEFGLKPKEQVARDIIDTIIHLFYAH